MELTLNPQVKEALQREFIEAIHGSGLVFTEKHIAEYGMQFILKQKNILSKKYTTPYMVAKYRLLPDAPTLKTIKNMVADGRIAPNEYFIDKKGNMQIMMFAIKRLRNE